MEARVKATGEIINVKEVIQYDSNYKSSVYYKAENGFPYKKEHLDFKEFRENEGSIIRPTHWMPIVIPKEEKK